MSGTGALSRQSAIVGVGKTRFVKQPGRSGMSLLAEAFPRALEDAGLVKEDIDGLIVQSGSPAGEDVDRVAEVLGIEPQFCDQPWSHGMWTATLIAHAAMAVYCGLANCVLVGRGISQTTPRALGGTFGGPTDPEGYREGGGIMGEMPHFGMTSPGAGAAMAVQRYFHRFGGSSADLAAVAIASRKHAALNPDAAMQRPITVEDHQASPWIVEPLHLLDYCQVSDGGACIIVCSAERARSLRQRPGYIAGVQGLHLGRREFIFATPGLGVQRQLEFDFQPTESDLAALRMAGVTQADVDGFYTYDAFTPLTPFALERYGYAPPGEGLRWIQGGRIELGGELPTTTHGGLHSEGHSCGWGAMVEMVLQLRGACGGRQIPNAEVLHWAPIYGNAMVLTN
jgi:acetyl-CoA acetyltransferase